MSRFKAQGLLLILLPWLVLVFLHLLSGLQMEQPLILADEVGYLGNARYLGGTAPMPNMQTARFYHFGYSLLILPAFWWFSDPVSIYRAAIATNALLTSSLYFPLYLILVDFLDVSKKIAMWIAFSCCLYPAFMLYSNFAWADTVFVSLVALTTLLFGRFLGSRSTLDLVLFSGSAGFLYTVHPRALPVLILVVVYLFSLAALRSLSKGQALLSTATIGAILMVTRIANGHLRDVGWGGAGDYSVARLAGRLLPGSTFPLLIQRSLGQVLYLSLASYGLFLVGLTAAIWYVLEHRSAGSPRSVTTDPKAGVRIFALITALGVFVASLTVKLFSTYGPHGIRGAGFIPGRYNESFAALFLAFALADICRHRPDKAQFVRRAIAVTSTLLVLAALVSAQIRSFVGTKAGGGIPASLVNALDVPGVFPVADLLGELDLYLVAFAAVGGYLAVTALMRVSKRAGLILLATIFAWSSIYNYRHYLQPARDGARPRLTFISQATGLGSISSVSFDRAYRDAGLLYGSQYLLPHTRFELFDSRRGDEPESQVVISGTDWGQAHHLGAELVLQEGNGDFALWVMPGDLQSSLPPTDYEGLVLGAQPAFRVRESGFHRQEWLDGAPVRWTNGAASLKVVLDPERWPQTLEIETVAYNRNRVHLQLLANGVELWNRQIPPEGWSQSFDLGSVPVADSLLLELNSDTFSPADLSGSPTDQGTHGVMVKGIWLKPSESSG